MSDDEKARSYTCVECGLVLKEPVGDTPLISTVHGWRLVRPIEAKGNEIPGWRCPACWPRYKERTARGLTPPTFPPDPFKKP